MQSITWGSASAQLTIAPFASGAFVVPQNPIMVGGYSITPAQTTIFNQALPPNDGVVEYKDIRFEQSFAELNRIFGGIQAANIKQFTVDDFRSYEQGMLDAVTDLKRHVPHFILVPLRGGEKPRQIIDALLNHQVPFASFGFTHKGNPIYAKQYLNELRTILVEYSAKHGNDLRFAVLDAGKGGDSANILAKWIRRLHQEIGGVWRVQLHVFHTPEWPKQPFEAGAWKSAAGLSIKVRTHTVSHLLVEDWEPGLAIRADFDGEAVAYKSSVVPGAVFISWPDGQSALLASQSAAVAVTKAISLIGTDYMNETLLRDPTLDSSSQYNINFKLR